MNSTDSHGYPQGHPGSTGPRLEPVSVAQATPEQAELLEPLGGDGALNLFRTLAHNPPVMRSWLRFAGRLLQRSSLPERDREVVILRVAARCRSDYEWGQHVGIARAADLSDAEIERIGEDAPADDGTLSPQDVTLIAAVDQLIDHHRIDEHTWDSLAESYDESQLVELTLLAGHYAMLAGALSSLGVQTESPLPKVGATR